MKKIPLTQGMFAIVDDEDYEYLSKFKWHACRVKGKNIFYAKRNLYENGIHTTVFMHRKILNTIRELNIDHINGNTLDNRKINLREVTTRQNLQNIHKAKTSKYPGVYWSIKDKRWRAQIQVNGTRKHLGNFKTEIEAYEAYKNAVFETGDFIIKNKASFALIRSEGAY